MKSNTHIAFKKELNINIYDYIIFKLYELLWLN